MIGFYVQVFAVAFLLTFILTPLARGAALRWGVLDRPVTAVKTHKAPVPYLGGVALFLGILGALVLVRTTTHFPSGTLQPLRAVLLGAGFMVLVGLVDDLRKPDGLSFQAKFLFQFIGALLLILFDVRIRFVDPPWLAAVLTVLWVAGISNALNLIDIMDGLAASQALVAAVAFLVISLPTEAVYVNVCAAAVAGACLAFLPHNFSTNRKIFMGDAGSLMLGFLLAGLSLGTQYTRWNEVGVFAPILILGLPVYDTAFVSILRLLQGKSPFLGSKDHLALKLRAMGLSTVQVVLLFAGVAVGLSAAAYLLTLTPLLTSLIVVLGVCLIGLFVLAKLHDVVVH